MKQQAIWMLNNDLKLYVAERSRRPKSDHVLKSIDIVKTPCPELARIFSGIAKFDDIDIYVHGSWADDSKTAFSDLDDLIIVDDKYLRDRREKRRLEKALSRVEIIFQTLDPIQHHGHWIIFRSDLDDLDESYMPLKAVEGAVLIKGDKTVTAKINIQASLIGFKANLKNTLRVMRRLRFKYRKNKINIFEMKQLVGSVFIACPYVFQSKGEMLDKKEAIEKKNLLFSTGTCLFIDKCTEIRKEWHRCMQGGGYTVLRWLSRVIANPFVYRNLARFMAPRFPVRQFPPLADDEFEKFFEEVEQYCQ